MPVEVEEVVRVLANLAEEEGLKVAVTESLKGGLITGVFATAGGLLLGPPGIALGGAVGGSVGYAATYGKFKAVAIVLTELPQEKKQRLYNQVKSILNKLTIEDAVALAMLVSADAGIKAEILMALKAFVINDLSMQIKD